MKKERIDYVKLYNMTDEEIDKCTEMIYFLKFQRMQRLLYFTVPRSFWK